MKIVHSDIALDDDEEDDSNKICLICHQKIILNGNIELDNIKVSNDDVCVLNCSHKYHYDCIINAYKINKYKKKCPYCRADGGYINLIPGVIPKYGIHIEYNEYMESNRKLTDINYISGKCKYILTRGKNSGKQCSSNIKKINYCTRHFKLLNNLENSNNMNNTNNENINNENINNENNLVI